MAIAQQSHYWRCLAEPGGQVCGKIFHDPSGDAPCPTCGNSDDSLIEPTSIEVQVKEVPQSKAQPAPATQPQAKPAQAPKQAQPTSALRVMPTGPVVGLAALLVGLPLWVEGARAIRDGMIVAANWIFDRAGVPFDVPNASAWVWWAGFGAMVALGVLFRVVEINYVPFRMPRWAQFFQFRHWTLSPIWEHWIVWLALIVIDVSMVYIGARTDPAPLTVTEQIAASGQAAAVYAIIITFLPDRVIQWGWRRIFPRNK